MSRLSIILVLALASESLLLPFSKKFLRETIDLPPPETTGGMNLYQAMTVRQSRRDYVDGTDLDPQDLSNLLWAGYGYRTDGGRTSASSHGVYPFDVYVFKADGTYKYLPETNQLEVINNRDFRAITGGQDFVAYASVNIVLAGDLDKLDYAEDLKTKKIKCELNSGHALQNMLMYAAAKDIKNVPRAMFVEGAIEEVLGLDPDRYYVTMTASFGL